MNYNEKQIDRLFQSKLEHYQEVGSENLWDRLDSALESSPQQGTRSLKWTILFWFSLSLFALPFILSVNTSPISEIVEYENFNNIYHDQNCRIPTPIKQVHKNKPIVNNESNYFQDNTFNDATPILKQEQEYKPPYITTTKYDIINSLLAMEADLIETHSEEENCINRSPKKPEKSTTRSIWMLDAHVQSNPFYRNFTSLDDSYISNYSIQRNPSFTGEVVLGLHNERLITNRMYLKAGLQLNYQINYENHHGIVEVLDSETMIIDSTATAWSYDYPNLGEPIAWDIDTSIQFNYRNKEVKNSYYSHMLYADLPIFIGYRTIAGPLYLNAETGARVGIMLLGPGKGRLINGSEEIQVPIKYNNYSLMLEGACSIEYPYKQSILYIRPKLQYRVKDFYLKENTLNYNPLSIYFDFGLKYKL